MRMKRKEVKIGAVLESELEALLQKLGLLEQMEAGAITCVVCGNVITVKKVGFVFSEGGEIKACCDRAECYAKLARMRERGHE